MNTKKISIVLVALLILPHIPLSQAVEKPYKIDSSTTWSGTIEAPDLGFFLDHDVTLTIAPGTRIHMKKNVSVKGSIVAIGTPDEPIIITSSSSDPKPGDWGFFEFPENCGECIFSNVIFEYGGDGGSGMLRFSAGNGIDDRVRLDNCIIRHSSTQGVWMASAKAVIRECTFTDLSDPNKGVGIWIQSASNPSVTGCTFERCTIPIYNDLSSSSHFLANRATNCDVNGIVLGKGSVDGKLILSATMPYVIREKFIVGEKGEMLIQRGVTIKCSSMVNVYGDISIRGTEEEPVIWTSLVDDSRGGDTNADGNSTTPAPGDWGHLELAGSAGECLFTHAKFFYGGGLGDQGAGWGILKFGTKTGVDNRVKLHNCDVGYSQTAGIWMQDSSPSIYSCNIHDNTNPELGACITLTSRSKPILFDCKLMDSGFAIITDTFSYPNAKDLTVSGNDYNVVYFTHQDTTASIEENAIWNAELVHYIPNTIEIKPGVTLRLMPGVIIKLGDHFRVNGKIVAIGSEDEPIVFTSLSDDEHGGDSNGDEDASKPLPGDNRGVQCREGNGLSVFKHCKFLYGGAGGNGCIYLGQPINKENEQILVNCEMGYSLGAGVNIRSGNVGIEGCRIHHCTNENTGWAVNIERDANVTVVNTEIDNCVSLFHMDPEANFSSSAIRTSNLGASELKGGHAGIHILKGTLKEDRVWDSQFPYILDDTLTIDEGATLTIKPGNIVKTLSSINAYGSLNCLGTETDPIYFTSIKDDAVGGDSNLDGDNTVPKLGDFGQVVFAGSSGECSINHTVFRYGGGGVGSGTIKLGEFGGVTDEFKMKNCSVTDSSSRGFFIYKSRPIIEDTIISGCTNENGDGVGIKITSDSDPAMKRMSFSNCDVAVDNISTNDVWITESWWGDMTGPYNDDWNPEGKGLPCIGTSSVIFNPPAEAPIPTCGAGGKGGELPEWKAPESAVEEIPALPMALKVEPNFVSAKMGTIFDLVAINGKAPYEFSVLDESICELLSVDENRASFKVTGSEATIINISDASNQIRQVWVTVPEVVLPSTEFTVSPMILPIRVGHSGTFKLFTDLAPQVKIPSRKSISVENNGDTLTVYAKSTGIETIQLITAGYQVDLKVICFAPGKTDSVGITDFHSAPGPGVVRLSWSLPTIQETPVEGIVLFMNGKELKRLNTDVTAFTVTGLSNGQEYTFSIKPTNGGNEIQTTCIPGQLGNTIVLWLGKNTATVNGKSVTIDEDPSVVPKVVGAGHTVIPFRFLAESLGAEVGWDGNLREVSFWTPTSYLRVYLGKTYGYLWDTQVTIDPAPDVVSGRTLIPLRVVSELLGAEVGWDGREKKITVQYTRPWFSWW
jgi:hypothetical protein